MSQPKQPVIGEKPSCPHHPENHLDWTCSAGLCPYRALCKECLTEHELSFPHHSEQVSPLNDWYKQYKKLAKNFDPRESSQTSYHVDEVGMILKKEKYELEKIAKTIDDSFEGALSILFNKLKNLKEYLHDYLWRDFNKVSESYNSLVKKFNNLHKFNPKDVILDTMKQDLQKYFSQGNLKEYFDQVYSGFYDRKVFNTKLNTEDMIASLKDKRRTLEDNFSVFESEEFESKWTQEVDKFIRTIEATCDDVIFKKTKLDFLNPKSPKLVPSGNKNPVSAKITCLSSLQNGSFINKVDEGLFMTLSDSRSLNFLDSHQSFRVLKSENLGDDIIGSTELLYLEPQKRLHNLRVPPPFLLLLGGDDDCPSLEVWDCLRDKKLACLENVHEYKVSCLLVVKKEVEGLEETFYVVSGSSDDFLKLWKIDVLKPPEDSEDPTDYKVKIKLIIRKKVHDSFIAAIVSVPASKKFLSGIVISCSQDKSINFWEWEKELKSMKSKSRNKKFRENGCRTIEINADLDSDEDEVEAYCRRIKYAHTDRIQDLILIHEKEDYSDLEYYATGGGDGMFKIWRFSDDSMVKTFANSDHSSIFSMAYLKKDRIACTANQVYLKHFYALIWNWKTSTLLLSIRDHQARVCKITFIGDGVFATCDKDKHIKLWQLESDASEFNDLKSLDADFLGNGSRLLSG